MAGYTKDPALIDRLLSMTLDDSIRAQDVFYVYGTLAGKNTERERERERAENVFYVYGTLASKKRETGM